MVKDTPLLMKGPLVCATLEDRKTQTRRLNGLDAINLDAGHPSAHMWKYQGVEPVSLDHLFMFADGINTELIKCPYGKQGDRLWVRETLGNDGDGDWLYTADNKYLSMDAPNEWRDKQAHKISLPSIHMPRWASRINLEITDIRVERVQEISEVDGWAEGCKKGMPTDNGGYFPAEEPHPTGGTIGWDDPQEWFSDLWDTINAARGYPWKDNPWVWVVEFKRVEAV